MIVYAMTSQELTLQCHLCNAMMQLYLLKPLQCLKSIRKDYTKDMNHFNNEGVKKISIGVKKTVFFLPHLHKYYWGKKKHPSFLYTIHDVFFYPGPMKQVGNIQCIG